MFRKVLTSSPLMLTAGTRLACLTRSFRLNIEKGLGSAVYIGSTRRSSLSAPAAANDGHLLASKQPLGSLHAVSWTLPRSMSATGKRYCPELTDVGAFEIRVQEDDVINSYSGFDDFLFKILSDSNGLVSVTHLQRALRNSGLWKNDPRLSETLSRIQRYMNEAEVDTTGDVLLSKEQFYDCIHENIVLIRRAFTGDFVIPEFSKFCAVVDEMYWTCRTNSTGKVASYIPQLARYSPDYWGVSLCTVDGQRHSIGDVEVPFTIQSGSMPLNYALATNELGADMVHNYVGHEPSGESFAHIKLNQDNKPHNPLINSGAIMVTSLIKRELSAADKFDYLLTRYRQLAGGEYLGFNNAAFLAEKEIAHRNFALAYYMKENRCFPDNVDIEAVIDTYFQLCAVEINVNSGAVIAATLANGGYCPITSKKLLDATSVRNTLSIMHSCGMYEYSGGFAFRVGLPAKSTISGAILLVVPNVMGMCLWSPPLDDMGNSARSLQFCEHLVKSFNFHHYDNVRRQSQKIDPRLRQSTIQGSRIINMMFGAFNSDLSALRRMLLSNQDMSVADYDGRTPLHIAASEGHLDCVKFLVEKCYVPVTPKDRWNRTPADDAKKFGRTEVLKYLEEFEKK